MADIILDIERIKMKLNQIKNNIYYAEEAIQNG